ncbi:MAG: permease-like cell division protein FtsX [Bacteroidota bacterium]
MEVTEVKIRKKKKLGSYPYLSVVFSITLALFVIGLFGLLLIYANRLTQVIQENVEIQVFLNQTISPSDRLKIQKTLASKEYIEQQEGQEAVIFISKEEAAQDFIAETGEDFRQFLGENPLRDAFVIHVKPEYYESAQLSKIKLDIERQRGVFEVAYVESLIDAINRNVTKISIILVSFAVLLIIIVAILINNTIRLALFSQRFLIRSMQLVGATASFIQRPFLSRSLLHGILGGIFAGGLLFALTQYAQQQVTDLAQLQSTEELIILIAALLVIGGFMGFISTYRAVKKYLRMSLDQLY